jgi:hypothetical protein
LFYNYIHSVIDEFLFSFESHCLEGLATYVQGLVDTKEERCTNSCRSHHVHQHLFHLSGLTVNLQGSSVRILQGHDMAQEV